MSLPNLSLLRSKFSNIRKFAHNILVISIAALCQGFVAVCNTISKNAIYTAIEKILGAKKKDLIPLNLKAFDEGCNSVFSSL